MIRGIEIRAIEIRGIEIRGIASRAVSVLALVAAAVLLLAGCRGGATAAPTVDTPDRAAVASSATGQPDAPRLVEVESTLDRIERELDADGSR